MITPDAPLRGLTLTQPRATLVALDAKAIETRSWRTAYRGPLAIHAGAGLGPVGGKMGLQTLCAKQPFRTAIDPVIYEVREWRGESYPVWDLAKLPRGAIVAVAELVDCVPTEILTGAGEVGRRLNDGSPCLWVLDGDERAFGDYAPGRYAWLLANVRRLAEPVPCRGAQGLWSVPPAVRTAVEAQLCPA